MKRDHSLDVLRGLMLVIMAVDHINGPLKRITYQPLGFFSAAEGFIFLSGLVFGLVYGRRLITRGFEFTNKKSFQRAGVIYFYHIVILLGILAFYALNPDYISFLKNNDVRLFFDHPLRSFLLYSTFLLQPGHFDILPLYVVLVLIGAYILLQFNKRKAATVFTVSILIYIFSQFQWWYQFRLTTLSSMINLGFFNIFSWQLLFILGMYTGYLRANDQLILKRRRSYFLIAVSLSGIFFISRHSLFESSGFFETIGIFSDRVNLGIIRLLNFLCFAYIADYLKSKNIFIRSHMLSFLGKHSLQVFSFHILVLYLAKPVIDVLAKNQASMTLMIFQIAFTMLLFIPALAHHYFRKRFREVPG